MNVLDNIHANPNLDTPLVVQFKQQLTWLIASGLVKNGDRLPSVRRMAEHLAINLPTVRSAYLRLEVQGLVETRQDARSCCRPSLLLVKAVVASERKIL